MSAVRQSDQHPSDDRDFLASLDERMRRIAEEVFEQKRAAGGDEWLSVEQACQLTNLSEWHVRQFARELREKGSPDVYQPNAGRPPLRIRRAALLDLKAP